MIQGNYVSTGGDLAAVKNYVWSRILWNPELDTDEVTRSFCNGYYGRAGKDIYQYIQTLEDAVAPSGETADIHINEFAGRGHMTKTYLREDIREILRSHLDAALAKAMGIEPYERRVKEAIVSLDAFELWTKGPLEERDGWMIRTDFGENTWPKAQNVLKYSRNANPKEYGIASIPRQRFLALHGGPVRQLSKGDLDVRVSPYAGGVIRGITYKEKEFLSSHTNPQKRRNRNNVYMQPGMRSKFNLSFPSFSELGSPPYTTSLILKALAGITNDKPNPKQEYTKLISIQKDNQFTVTLKAKQRDRLPIYSKADATSQRDYLVGSKASDYDVKVKRIQGWETVKPSTPRGVSDLNLITGIRVTFKEQGYVMDDFFDRPIANGQMIHHPENGVLSVVLQIPRIDLPRGREQDLFLSTISFYPIHESPPLPEETTDPLLNW
jgi:hypothetical protein